MKYMNFLAGALCLMALAACNSVIEQPNALSTITVAYNQGPATRTTISPDPAASSGLYKYLDGIKVTWTSGDRIALIKDGIKYIYETEEEGEVATFTLVGETGPTEDGDYKMIFPGDWDGNLSDFSRQDLSDFSPENYLYATGTATLTDGAFEQTATLVPIFSFLFFDEGLVFNNMQLMGFEEDGYVDEDSRMFNITLDLTGDNLFSEIVNYEAPSEASTIFIDNLGIYCPDGSPWSCEVPYIIAIPVFEEKPVTNLKLLFDGSRCYVYNSDQSAPLTIDRGGLLYCFSGDNLFFRVQ